MNDGRTKKETRKKGHNQKKKTRMYNLMICKKCIRQMKIGKIENSLTHDVNSAKVAQKKEREHNFYKKRERAQQRGFDCAKAECALMHKKM